MDKMTVGEVFDRFDRYLRVPVAYDEKTGVMLHYHDDYVTVTPEYFDSLKQALERKIFLIQYGVEEPDPITTFALLILSKTY